MLIDEFDLNMDAASTISASKQMADALKCAIIKGAIRPGFVLPSVRDLAGQLNISRSTASRAIEALSAQGYVVAERGSGTRVASHLPGQSQELLPASIVARDVALSRFGEWLKQRHEIGKTSTKLHYDGPRLRDLPLNIWRELLVKHCRSTIDEEVSYVPEPFGFPPLREAYVSYLIRARAAKVTQERLAVFASRNLRLDLICRLLLDEGDVIAMEDPGFFVGREQFLAIGAKVVPIDVDGQGMVVEQLETLAVPPRLIYCTPSHQAPTGAVMPMGRRKKLLDYAAAHDAYIIEDDYDSEFRYDGRPLPCLQGMDTNDRTIYLSCLWTVMAPVSRIGFMVVPETLVAAMNAAKCLVERDVSLVEQAAIADFINEGHLEKLIRRQRTKHAAQRQIVINKLESILGKSVWIAPESAGLEVLVRFETAYHSEQIEKAIADSGMPMYSTAAYYMSAPRPLEYVIAFAGTDEEELALIVEKFASQLARLA
ncbi:MAG: PLP-dependent aminotransferase family protein [Candidatus Obscuribacter sp.]|nr:PLP-dependent aminotransferase family protein [Candidatus Obscuribacter sp.]MBP6592181.1 PLP-dependent aminotransferase family protein [Candidatus Obscuribacter sp.]